MPFERRNSIPGKHEPETMRRDAAQSKWLNTLRQGVLIRLKRYYDLGNCFLRSSRNLLKPPSLCLFLQSLCIGGTARNQRTSCPGHCDGRNPSAATFSEITCTKTSYECLYYQPPLKPNCPRTDWSRNVILNIWPRLFKRWITLSIG